MNLVRKQFMVYKKVFPISSHQIWKKFSRWMKFLLKSDFNCMWNGGKKENLREIFQNTLNKRFVNEEYVEVIRLYYTFYTARKLNTCTCTFRTLKGHKYDFNPFLDIIFNLCVIIYHVYYGISNVWTKFWVTREMHWTLILTAACSVYLTWTHWFWLLNFAIEMGHTAGATVQQGMLTPPRHLIPPPVFPGVRFGQFVYLTCNSYLNFETDYSSVSWPFHATLLMQTRLDSFFFFFLISLFFVLLGFFSYIIYTYMASLKNIPFKQN
jgi:hypothetical protein